VESSNEWYLNDAGIVPDNLPNALRTQIGARLACTVIFDAGPEVPYAIVIHAVDLTEQTPGRVVLLTPQTKRVHIP
jgi:hypothetical protein